MKTNRKFNPYNPQQVKEFERLIVKETSTKVGKLEKAPQAIVHVASTQLGREYLAKKLGSKAYRFGRNLGKANHREISLLAHELSHVIQQSR